MVVSYRVVSLAFLDCPDWQVLDDHVAIGNIYRIEDSSLRRCWMRDQDSGRERQVTVGWDVDRGGFIPLDTMELLCS